MAEKQIIPAVVGLSGGFVIAGGVDRPDGGTWDHHAVCRNHTYGKSM